MRTFPGTATILLTAAVWSFSTPAQAQQPATQASPRWMTGAELNALFAAPIRFSLSGGRTRSYRPDGTVQSAGATFSSPGQYRIEGDTLCESFQFWKNGQWFCSSIAQTAPGTYAYHRHPPEQGDGTMQTY